jgi:hypothetical protein
MPYGQSQAGRQKDMIHMAFCTSCGRQAEPASDYCPACAGYAVPAVAGQPVNASAMAAAGDYLRPFAPGTSAAPALPETEGPDYWTDPAIDRINLATQGQQWSAPSPSESGPDASGPAPALSQTYFGVGQASGPHDGLGPADRQPGPSYPEPGEGGEESPEAAQESGPLAGAWSGPEATDPAGHQYFHPGHQGYGRAAGTWPAVDSPGYPADSGPAAYGDATPAGYSGGQLDPVGRSYAGNSYPGQAYPEQPPADSAYPGQAYPGQAYPGQAYASQAYPGQAYASQAYADQSYPDQPYPDRPFQERAYPEPHRYGAAQALWPTNGPSEPASIAQPGPYPEPSQAAGPYPTIGYQPVAPAGLDADAGGEQADQERPAGRSRWSFRRANWRDADEQSLARDQLLAAPTAADPIEGDAADLRVLLADDRPPEAAGPGAAIPGGYEAAPQQSQDAILPLQRGRWVAVAAAAVVLIIAAATAVILLAHHGSPGGHPAASRQPGKTRSRRKIGPGRTAAHRLLTVEPQAASAPHAAAVQAFLRRYFTAINNHDYAAYRQLFSRELRGGLSATQFASGYGSSQDSLATLRSITVPAAGRVKADVTFVSHQRPADSATHSACTTWSISLFLGKQGGKYVIESPPAGYGATSAACS